MKLTNREIVNIINNIQGITTKKLPIKLSFAIQKNIKKLEEAAKEYDEARKRILEDNAEKDEDGKPVIEDNQYKIIDTEKNTKEILELLDFENEVEIHTIDLSMLEQCDLERFDSLTGTEVGLLSFMINE